MDAQQFFAEFGHIANAPGGITRLQQMINVLAVQGRLVPQNKAEESADAFIARLSVETAGSAKRQRSMISDTRQSMGKAIPQGWGIVALRS
jgi:type I restriction enzyme S subunit